MGTGFTYIQTWQMKGKPCNTVIAELARYRGKIPPHSTPPRIKLPLNVIQIEEFHLSEPLKSNGFQSPKIRNLNFIQLDGVFLSLLLQRYSTYPSKWSFQGLFTAQEESPLFFRSLVIVLWEP